jgi:integrase
MPRQRKLPDGMKVRNGEFHADFYCNGRRVRKRLSGDFDAACQILNELKSRADRADFGLLDNDYPLDSLRSQYLKHCRQTRRGSSADRYETSLANILPNLGARTARQVTIEGVVSYRQERLDQGFSPQTINMEVGTLGAMLNWGVDPANLIGSNPLAKLKPLPNPTPKQGRALSPDEVERLLSASPPIWRDIWYAYLVTGMRRMELATLTFRDVDKDNRELIVRASIAKNGRERRIPIEGGLWEILLRQEADRASRHPGGGRTAEVPASVRAKFSRDHVFISTSHTPLTHRSNVYKTFIRCCRKARIQVETFDHEGRQVEHVDIHSLRRTFATNLIANGADPKSVQELLGHKTLRMTMDIYTKIHVQTKRQTLGRLTYGRGVEPPSHLVQLPERGEAKVS